MKKYFTSYLGMVVLWVYTSAAFAQADSAQMLLRRLSFADILTQPDTAMEGKALSGVRSLQHTADLPFDMYIITKEEIQRNNCVTLADALKYAPGFRVSQPGNALQGETFLINGLLGNAYVKILINDIAIKPNGTRAMPLGAQLPIRQAERIEILYGPAADAYGADAAAGVINIILQQSERPAYVEADLFAGPSGYNDINVSFGGKIGDSRKGLRYRLYGSHTRANDRAVGDSPAFDVLNYGIDSAVLVNNPNYTQDVPFVITPFIGRMPYESRQLGLDLQWRRISISLSQHYRREHSALGQNPAAVSYADNGTFTGENITQVSGVYTLPFWKNFTWRALVNVNTYDMDPQSSVIQVASDVALKMNRVAQAIAAGDPVLLDSFQRSVYRRYFSGRRYQSVYSNSIKTENLLFYNPKPWIQLLLGHIIQNNEVTRQLFGTRPFYEQQSVFSSEDEAPYYYYTSRTQSNLLGQVFIHTASFSLLAGANRYRNFSDQPKYWNTRLAAQYKLSPKLRLRVSQSAALADNVIAYSAENYRVTNYPFSQPLDRMDIENRPDSLRIKPELSQYLDAGLHWSPRQKLEVALSWRRQRASQLVDVFDLTGAIDVSNPIIPLQNLRNGDGSMEWQSVQLSLSVRDLGKRKESSTSLYIQRGSGQEILSDGTTILPFVRQLPKWMIQSNTFVQLSRRAFVQINQQFLSGAFHAGVRDPQASKDPDLRQYQVPFYNLDIIGHLRITDNVQITLKMINATQTPYAGLTGGGPDELVFNPQRQRFTVFGLSYHMN